MDQSFWTFLEEQWRLDEMVIITFINKKVCNTPVNTTHHSFNVENMSSIGLQCENINHYMMA